MEYNKNDTKELIHKTETDSQISKSNLRLPQGKPWGKGDELRKGNNIYTLLYKIDN